MEPFMIFCSLLICYCAFLSYPGPRALPLVRRHKLSAYGDHPGFNRRRTGGML